MIFFFTEAAKLLKKYHLPNKKEPFFFCPAYMSRNVPLLEYPNKPSNFICREREPVKEKQYIVGTILYL